MIIESMLATLLMAEAALKPLPGSKWVGEFNTDGCKISRRFGQPDKFVVVALMPDVTMQGGRVLLIQQKPSGWTGTRRIVAKLRSAQDQPFINASGYRTPMQSGMELISVDANQDFWTNLGQAKMFEVNADTSRMLSLATGPLTKPMEAMRTCNDLLLRSWKVDPATLVVVPASAMLRWFEGTNYPLAARIARMQGRVQTIVTFNSAGKTLSCRVVTSSKSTLLDNASCDIFQEKATLPPSNLAERNVYAVIDWRLES